MELNSIYMMDCIEGMKQLPNEIVDLIIADPPFGLDFDGGKKKSRGNYNRNPDFVVPGYREVHRDKPYYDFSIDWMIQAERVLKPEGSMYTFSCWGNLQHVLDAADDLGLFLRNHLIWYRTFGVYTSVRWTTSHYHILHFTKGEKVKPVFVKVYKKHPKTERLYHYPEDVLFHKVPREPGKKKNATKLPLKQIELLIRTSSHRGDIVLDPFVGGGTVPRACKRLDRKFIGFEINENLEPIIRQWGINTFTR